MDFHGGEMEGIIASSQISTHASSMSLHSTQGWPSAIQCVGWNGMGFPSPTKLLKRP